MFVLGPPRRAAVDAEAFTSRSRGVPHSRQTCSGTVARMGRRTSSGGNTAKWSVSRRSSRYNVQRHENVRTLPEPVRAEGRPSDAASPLLLSTLRRACPSSPGNPSLCGVPSDVPTEGVHVGLVAGSRSVLRIRLLRGMAVPPHEEHVEPELDASQSGSWSGPVGTKPAGCAGT